MLECEGNVEGWGPGSEGAGDYFLNGTTALRNANVLHGDFGSLRTRG